MNTFSRFSKFAFNKIAEIIDDSNAVHTYRILGYKTLGMKLILEFHDCEQIHEFDLMLGEYDESCNLTCEYPNAYIARKIYYTADYIGDEAYESVRKFSDDFKSYKIDPDTMPKVFNITMPQ